MILSRLLPRSSSVMLVAVLACNRGDSSTQDAPPTPSASDTPTKSVDPPVPTDAETSDQAAAQKILDRAVEAVGGRDKLENLASFHYSGTISIKDQAIEGTIELWWKAGDFYTVQKIPGLGVIEAGKSGEQLWSRDPFLGLRELTGVEAHQQRWASSPMLASDWQTYFDHARVKPSDDQKLELVELRTDGDHAPVTLGFHPETGLLETQSFVQKSPMGDTPVTSVMSDYRDVEGLRISFRQTTETPLATAVQVIDSLEVNGPVDVSQFKMPTGGAEDVVDGQTLKSPPDDTHSQPAVEPPVEQPGDSP